MGQQLETQPAGKASSDAPALIRETKTDRPRQSWLKRNIKKTVKQAKQLNRRCAVHGDRPVFDNSDFPWVAKLEAAAPDIRRELDAVLTRKDELAAFHEVISDTATITRDQRWKTFAFTAYGLRSERNIAQCPRTWAAVQAIPGLRSALFSILEPGKHIPAHKGPYNGVLRAHLGLVIPKERSRVTIRVDDQHLQWEEGKVMIFDDSFEHEVWNDTDETRVVLFIDFDKPLRFPAGLVHRTLMSLAPFTPFLREGAEQQLAWEDRFYGRR
jgi:beta-hydroxylase